jgi:hypothetical protein
VNVWSEVGMKNLKAKISSTQDIFCVNFQMVYCNEQNLSTLSMKVR